MLRSDRTFLRVLAADVQAIAVWLFVRRVPPCIPSLVSRGVDGGLAKCVAGERRRSGRQES